MPNYRTISLWQPYPKLIEMEIKRYETRSWKPSLKAGDLILIHAARRKMTNEDFRVIAHPLVRHAVMEYSANKEMTITPHYGAILCLVRYKGCVSTNEFSPKPLERVVGNYQPNRWAWELELLERFDEPIQAKGHQGFWMFSMPERGE